jgi:hypothetical protein
MRQFNPTLFSDGILELEQYAQGQSLPSPQSSFPAIAELEAKVNSRRGRYGERSTTGAGAKAWNAASSGYALGIAEQPGDWVRLADFLTSASLPEMIRKGTTGTNTDLEPFAQRVDDAMMGPKSDITGELSLMEDAYKANSKGYETFGNAGWLGGTVMGFEDVAIPGAMATLDMLRYAPKFMDELIQSGMKSPMNSQLGAFGTKADDLAQSADSLPVRPAKENLQTVIESNMVGGRVVGDESVPIDSLSGGASVSSRGQGAVDKIAAQMSGPDGYIERLIVDQDGNVVEGAHRLDALRKLGVKDVPVTRISDPTAHIDVTAMEKAIRDVGSTPSDHVNRIVADVGEMLDEVGGDPAKVLEQYEFPAGFEDKYRAALSKAQSADSK